MKAVLVAKAIGAWAALNWFKVVATVLLMVLIVVGMRACQDKQDSADTVALKSALKTDSVEKKFYIAQHAMDSAHIVAQDIQMNTALANGTKVVTQWRDNPPAALRSGSTHDSLTQQTANVKACRDAGDKLVASIVELKSSCSAYRDTAKAIFKHDSSALAVANRSYAHLDSLYGIAQKGKRIHLYGDFLYEPLKQRPVIGVGGTAKLFWKVDAKADVQFSVPRAKPDSTDGMRYLGGLEIRFK